ncbi:hypothetical protein HID58_050748 [Brassica napus]|uniref:Uncharacterized protein n=1 Tax=Brassica napus TaxID=3708 RepID=A0ABQ8A700_BRANA|nr:hypothetical protein HID58_050748 [Brassica napus]
MTGFEDNPKSRSHLLLAGAFIYQLSRLFSRSFYTPSVLHSRLIGRRPPPVVRQGVCQPPPLKPAGATSVSVRLQTSIKLAVKASYGCKLLVTKSSFLQGQVQVMLDCMVDHEKRHVITETKRVMMSSERSKEKKRSICRRLGKYIKEQKGRIYIIRRCVVMLLCWHD